MSYEKGNTKLRESEHLNHEERKTIERQLRAGVSKKAIALLLVRDISTIKREIKRGTVVQRKRNPYQGKKINYREFIEYKAYLADAGQRVYEKNRQNCGAKNKIIKCKELVNFVESKILSPEKWSPDAAIGYARENGLFQDMVTTKTFYNWIEDSLIRVKNIDLHLKVRRKESSTRKERKKCLGKSIDERPAEVDMRELFGHWEGDGIVGKGGKGHIITLVERKHGIGLMWNVQDRKEDKILTVLKRLKNGLGEHFREVFKTITFDNGAEFSACEEMEKLGGPVIYYAHPYSAWERPTNEHWNGLVRRFIPKGKSFSDLTDNDMERIAHYINTLPRKRLGYKTPLQLWEDELQAILSV